MKILNLERIHQILGKISQKEYELSEYDKFVQLLGTRSQYYAYKFEDFLNRYSFKIEEGSLIIFNDDSVPWEDFTNNDYSYLPLQVLEMNDKQLDEWINKEIEKQLKQQQYDKLAEKQQIEEQIKNLQKRLKLYEKTNL